MAIKESELKTSTNGYKVIGTRPIRHDGADKVTGRAVYGTDMHLPGMLYGKVLRSPHAHARIVSIDTSAAEALPGVKADRHRRRSAAVGDKIEDLGESSGNLRYMSENILAHDKVLYHGHAVAAVAADSIHMAEEAANLIKVEYELLPVLLDGREAMKPDAPILHRAPAHRRTGQDGRQADQCGRPHSAQTGRSGGGLCRRRRDRRARVPHRDGAPGLHRTAQRHGHLERRRPHPGLVAAPRAPSACAARSPTSCRCRSPR